MFVTGASDILPLPPVAGKNDANKNQASKQAVESQPPVHMDSALTYFSPVVRIDPETQQTIIIFREGDGEVKRQYPSEEELEAYREKRLSDAQKLPTAPVPNGEESADAATDVAPVSGGNNESQPVGAAPAPSTETSEPAAPKPATGNDSGGETPISGGSDITV